MEKELQKLIVQTSEIMGCRAKVHYKYMLPPLSNDSGLTSIAYKAAERLFGEQAIVHVPPIMASEDFAFYTENIPGIYVNIGCALEDNMYGYSNYSPHFQVDESVLKKGTALCVQFVKDFFGKEGNKRWRNI